MILLLAACAHKQELNPVTTASSVSWPILPIQSAIPASDAAPNQAGLAQETTATVLAICTAAPSKDVTGGPALTASAPMVANSGLIPKVEIPPGQKNDLGKPSQINIPSVKTVAAKPGSEIDSAADAPLIFDIPVVYNSRVKYWISYFQTTGRNWYIKWLERSSRYLPILQKTLKRHELPQDLAYIAMIESGFSSQASSSAKAVGPWQFIRETGARYGLKVSWWLDERRDFQKSTDAAAKYLKTMYNMFHNWYLVAAGYNTGENRIKRVIAKHNTKNFWKMARNKALERETEDYVPKLIAALLIAKAPQMYGFNQINYNGALTFDHFTVPGGTRLDQLADAIGVTDKLMQELNPELIRGYVPNFVEGHLIRIPKGSTSQVSRYIRKTFVTER